MAVFSGDHWTFIFGLCGNIISFFVFLAPLPTFYKIYKKKSTDGFQSIPYVVALFSAMLWIYYAFLKSNTTLLITINSFGCFIETLYVCFFLFYASKKDRIHTMKLLLVSVFGGFGAIVLVTQFLFKGVVRAQVVGWICLVFSLCVFVAPLCILRQVMRTKSVEHMPFLLSVFLTLSAVAWFFYGLLLKDFNIAIPNVLGFVFGILQILLYAMYRKKTIPGEEKLPEIVLQSPPVAVIILEENNNNYNNNNKKNTTQIPELTQEQIIDIMKLGSLQVCKDDKINVPSRAY
ncbi:PREDICTED: bidirectional sugar transporter SWEET12-like [Ipomoea nil]|uniref:bidirectional sugar transporter SWEET12-like n=1 Tax=Ipomoea nil TaxID=35883 RepID=UPI000900CA74|nr:PREDICTED: bidirectional sugar transporter SWEET12-like [Ipomoea nil]